MLAIRMQRTGRKGLPMYRVVVQDSHRQPTSGRVVANLGSYNPHTKEAKLDTEKAATFLKHGAQPSDRVVKLLQAEKVTLPKWVRVTSDKKQKTIKNSEKLRRNQPKDEITEEAEAPTAEAEVTNATDESAALQTEEQNAAEAPEKDEEPTKEAPTKTEEKSEDTTEANKV